MTVTIEPILLEQWLPSDQERLYVEQLLALQTGLTRRRASCFIRLWVYLMLKQAKTLPPEPIAQLSPVQGTVICTHREAFDLFYANSDRGSERAAGMMIDTLVELGLVEKRFDGNTLALGIRALPELTEVAPTPDALTLEPDAFNPRTDAVPIASFLTRSYSWLTQSNSATAHKIAKVLRQWANDYPDGIRVLRRCDNRQPVGISVFFPTASESEERFFLPPSHSLHLSTVSEVDPIKLARSGDRTCLSVFVRAWKIDAPYLRPAIIHQFLKDSQATLAVLRRDFPCLYDVYVLPIHPSDEALAQALGFQKTIQDPQSFLCWMYLSLDQFLELDVNAAIARLAQVSAGSR